MYGCKWILYLTELWDNSHAVNESLYSFIPKFECLLRTEKGANLHTSSLECQSKEQTGVTSVVFFGALWCSDWDVEHSLTEEGKIKGQRW